MMNKYVLDLHVNALVAAHGIGHVRIRKMLCCGLLPAIGEVPTSAHKAPSETLTEALQRMLEDGPAFTSREQFLDFRGKLAAGERLHVVILSERRIRQAAAVLHEEGRPLIVENIFEMAGGNRAQIAASLRWLAQEWPGGLERAVMVAADLEPHHLAAMTRSDLVPELSSDARERGRIDAAAVAADLRRRFFAWRPKRFEFQQVIDLGVMRNGLRLEWSDDNPPGVLDPLIDMMLRHQQVPTVNAVQTLISGRAAQIETHLRARARSTGEFPLPRRCSRGEWKAEDLREALPQQMSDLFNTALDPVRGSPHDALTTPKTSRIIENPHAQLQIIGAVVALHGPRTSALLRKSDKAEHAACNLARGLAGIDVTNPALLATGFDAIRLILRGVTDPSEVRQTLRDIDHWRFIVEVFEDYLATPGLPAATREFLSAFQPVWPSGGQVLFRQVKDELNEFTRESKASLDKKLQPLLEDVPGFVHGVLGAQAQLEALREHVRAQVAKEEKKGKGAVWPLNETFIASTLVGAVTTLDEYDYRVHRWADVMDRINTLTDIFTKPRPTIAFDPFRMNPGDERLFENRFVVEMLGCRRDGADADYQLDVIRLHRDYGFWKSRDLPDGEAYALRSARLEEFGLTEGTLSKTGGEIANFGRGKFIRARKARLLLGQFLFPIEEAHHSSLIGALQIAARTVEALRIGDLEQWNIGKGLETAFDEEGNPFTVLSSIPKKHVEPRKSPLTSECEDMAEKLLALASERFFQDRPIPEIKRAHYNGKGPERERMLFCNRVSGMAGTVINNNSRLLMGGNGGFQSHWAKYLWSKLRRSEGKSLDERRQGHGHKTEGMAAYYDVLTPDEKDKLLLVLHEQAETRAAHRRGERDSPLPDPPLSDLRLEAGRLANDIVFLAARGAAPQLEAARERLSLIEAKIRRAGEGGVSGANPHALEPDLEPAADDTRLVRLGKRAALLLISRDEPISRARLSAASKEVDNEPGRRKPGFSEASLRTNGLRRIYLLARSMPARSVVRRRGKVAAHILRMTKAEIATSLVVARMAALEREEEHSLALERLGTRSAAPAVEHARIERDSLAVNMALDDVPHPPAAADLKIAASRANADAVGRAIAWAEGRGIRPTAQWLAARCGLHPGTVERMAMAASAKEANAKTFGFEVQLPPSLMRHRKWDLGRALHVERSYIRALHDATMTIAAVVIEREQQERRALVRASQTRDAVR